MAKPINAAHTACTAVGGVGTPQGLRWDISVGTRRDWDPVPWDELAPGARWPLPCCWHKARLDKWLSCVMAFCGPSGGLV